ARVGGHPRAAPARGASGLRSAPGGTWSRTDSGGTGAVVRMRVVYPIGDAEAATGGRRPRARPLRASRVAASADRERARLVAHHRSEEHTSELQSRENLVCR